MSKITKRLLQVLLCIPALLTVGFLTYALLGGSTDGAQWVAAMCMTGVSVFCLALVQALEELEKRS